MRYKVTVYKSNKVYMTLYLESTGRKEVTKLAEKILAPLDYTILEFRYIPETVKTTTHSWEVNGK